MGKFKYSKKVEEKVVELLRSDSYTILEICNIIGIAEHTFYEWLNKKDDFAKAVEQARLDRMKKLFPIIEINKIG